MTNVTITMDDALLARARREADQAGKSLSRYLADLIAAEEERLRTARMAAMDGFLALANHVPLDRPDWKFDREEIYDRPYPGGHQRHSLQSGPGASGQAGAVRGVAERADGGEFDHGKPASVQRNQKRGQKKT
jgi:hypothetical protein